jgi:membrane associated rhomboid family serine protease
MQHTIQRELKGVLGFVAVLWAVFALDFVVPVDFLEYGVTPRTWSGLVGIPLMPFLHASWQHLVSNTVPLIVLLVLLAGSKARSWEVVAEIIVLGGILLWLFGRHATHIGASGLVFGLIAFLIVSGWRERRFVPLIVSVLVTFLYGGSFVFGVIPRMGSPISWEGHLLGGVAGGIIAWCLTGTPQPRKISGSGVES